MKKLFALLLLTLLMAIYAVPAMAANTTNTPPQLTADQLNTVNGAIESLLPLLPPSLAHYIVPAVLLISLLGHLGRIIQGYRTGGFFGMISGLFSGTNVPKPAGTNSQTPLGKVPLFLVISVGASVMLLGSGCGTMQVVTVTKGVGLHTDIPIGYNGANIAEFIVNLGDFENTVAVQPVSTNKVYTCPVAVLTRDMGKASAPQITGTNAVAGVSGGGDYHVNIGSGSETASGTNGVASTTNN